MKSGRLEAHLTPPEEGGRGTPRRLPEWERVDGYNRSPSEPAAAPHWFISVPHKTHRLPGYPCSADPGASCRPLHGRVIGWRWRSGYTPPPSNPSRRYTGSSSFLPSSPASSPSLLQVLPALSSCRRKRSLHSLRRLSSDCPERGWRQDCSWRLDHALASSGLPGLELLVLAVLARSSWTLDLSGAAPPGWPRPQLSPSLFPCFFFSPSSSLPHHVGVPILHPSRPVFPLSFLLETSGSEGGDQAAEERAGSQSAALTHP